MYLLDLSLLDLDLLPREGVDMGELFEITAPAGKCHCATPGYQSLPHGKLIPDWFRNHNAWCPNAGVVRLDPLPMLSSRLAQVASMVAEIGRRSGASYLPEQYYLAERLKGWRNIGNHWNWEVCPEWDDPWITHPNIEACKRAKQSGWASLYLDSWGEGDIPTGEAVLREVRVWHFSGISRETAPWGFLDLAGPDAVRAEAGRRFQARDPGGVVASSLAEWRAAYDALLAESATVRGLDALRYLRDAGRRLRMEAARNRCGKHQWACPGCGNMRDDVRKLTDLPRKSMWCSGSHWGGVRWACKECVVRKLRAVIAGVDGQSKASRRFSACGRKTSTESK